MPLGGRRLLLTRPDDTTGIGDALRQLGAAVIHIPATRVEPIASGVQVARAAYMAVDWVLWTSRHAIDVVFGPALPMTRAVPPLFACAGPTTAAALRAVGGEVAVTADPPNQDGLLTAMRAPVGLAECTMLFPAAAGARTTLEDGLRAAGATVIRVDCYESVPDAAAAETLRRVEADGAIDLAVFSAPSAVHAWVAAVGTAVAQRLPAASIGGRTTAACIAYGISLVAEAASSTRDALIAAIAASGHRAPHPTAADAPRKDP